MFVIKITTKMGKGFEQALYKKRYIYIYNANENIKGRSALIVTREIQNKTII